MPLHALSRGDMHEALSSGQRGCDEFSTAADDSGGVTPRESLRQSLYRRTGSECTRSRSSGRRTPTAEI